MCSGEGSYDYSNNQWRRSCGIADGWPANSGLCKSCVNDKQVYHSARESGENGMLAMVQHMMARSECGWDTYDGVAQDSSENGETVTSPKVSREVAEALQERPGPGGWYNCPGTSPQDAHLLPWVTDQQREVLSMLMRAPSHSAKHYAKDELVQWLHFNGYLSILTDSMPSVELHALFEKLRKAKVEGNVQFGKLCVESRGRPFALPDNEPGAQQNCRSEHGAEFMELLLSEAYRPDELYKQSRLRGRAGDLRGPTAFLAPCEPGARHLWRNSVSTAAVCSK